MWREAVLKKTKTKKSLELTQDASTQNERAQKTASKKTVKEILSEIDRSKTAEPGSKEVRRASERRGKLSERGSGANRGILKGSRQGKVKSVTIQND